MNKSKEAYHQYRERARELYACADVIHGEQHGTNVVLSEVRVPQHAHVSICEDGAFVEALVWVHASKFDRPTPTPTPTPTPITPSNYEDVLGAVEEHDVIMDAIEGRGEE